MRLYKRPNGYFYIEIERNRPFSLKTKDEATARQTYKKFEIEITLLKTHEILYNELKKAEKEIGSYLSKISSDYEVNPYASILKNKKRNSEFLSEDAMQDWLLSEMKKQFNLKNIDEYYKCKSGIVDVLCECENKKIILEFKLGKLSEANLGQCLRYLDDKKILANELWLIGESVDKTIRVFKKFYKIKLFVITKSNKAKYKTRRVYIK